MVSFADLAAAFRSRGHHFAVSHACGRERLHVREAFGKAEESVSGAASSTMMSIVTITAMLAMIATALCGTTNRSMPRMTVYLVAQLRFVDRPAYDRYQARFMDVFKQSEGRLLVADESPRVVEGSWDREKLVIMSFPSETSAREFLTSKEYEEIAKDRKAGADTLALLAREVSGG